MGGRLTDLGVRALDLVVEERKVGVARAQTPPPLMAEAIAPEVLFRHSPATPTAVQVKIYQSF